MINLIDRDVLLISVNTKCQTKNDRYKLKIRLRGHTLKCYLCTLLGTSKKNIDPKIWSDS